MDCTPLQEILAGTIQLSIGDHASSIRTSIPGSFVKTGVPIFGFLYFPGTPNQAPSEKPPCVSVVSVRGVDVGIILSLDDINWLHGEAFDVQNIRQRSGSPFEKSPEP